MSNSYYRSLCKGFTGALIASLVVCNVFIPDHPGKAGILLAAIIWFFLAIVVRFLEIIGME